MSHKGELSFITTEKLVEELVSRQEHLVKRISQVLELYDTNTSVPVEGSPPGVTAAANAANRFALKQGRAHEVAKGREKRKEATKNNREELLANRTNPPTAQQTIILKALSLEPQAVRDVIATMRINGWEASVQNEYASVYASLRMMKESGLVEQVDKKWVLGLSTKKVRNPKTRHREVLETSHATQPELPDTYNGVLPDHESGTLPTNDDTLDDSTLIVAPEALLAIEETKKSLDASDEIANLQAGESIIFSTNGQHVIRRAVESDDLSI